MRLDLHFPKHIRKFERDFKKVSLLIDSTLRSSMEMLQVLSYNEKIDSALNQGLLARHGFRIEVWEDPAESYRYCFEYKADGWSVSVVAMNWPLHGVFVCGSDEKDVPPDKMEAMVSEFYAVQNSLVGELEDFRSKCREKIKARFIEEEKKRWAAE